MLPMSNNGFARSVILHAVPDNDSNDKPPHAAVDAYKPGISVSSPVTDNPYGAKVTITVTLGPTVRDRAVSLYATPLGQPRRLVATGKVNAKATKGSPHDVRRKPKVWESNQQTYTHCKPIKLTSLCNAIHARVFVVKGSNKHGRLYNVQEK